MATKFSNFAETTLAQILAAGAITAYLSSATNFPTLGVGDTCRLTLTDGIQSPEIVTVTARSGTTITITRGEENTADSTWGAGTEVILSPTAEQLEDIYNRTISSSNFGVATVTATNQWTITMPAIPFLVDGTDITFIVPADNTDVVTIRLSDGVTNGSYFPLYGNGNHPLENDELQSGWMITARYDATDDVWIITTPYTNHLNATSINDAPFVKNWASNGDFEQWLAGTSLSTPASGSETADTFFVRYDGTIGTFTVSRQAFTVGQTDVPEEPKYFLRWDHTSGGSGSTFRDLEWRNEVGVRWAAGEDGNLGFYIRGASSYQVTVKIFQDFGTGGSPSSAVQVNSLTVNVTTSWQFVDLSQEFPSIAGKTLGSNNDDCVKVRISFPLNTTFRADIATFQVARGDRTSKFSPKTSSILDGIYKAASARSAIGLVIGTDVQAYDADLDQWATVTPSTFFKTLPVAASAAALNTLLGLGTGDSPQFAAVNVGHATDTTITRVSAGKIAVEGDTVSTLGATETFTGIKSARPSASGVRFNVGPDYNGGVAIETGESVLDIRAWTGAPTARLSRHNVNAWDIEVDSSGHLNFLDSGTAAFKMLSSNVLQVNGNTVYHAGNLPGTAVAWTATPRFSNGLNIGADGDILLYESATDAMSIRAGPSSGYFYTTFAANGVLAITGPSMTVAGNTVNVSGKQAIWVPAASMTPRTTNGPAPDNTQLGNGIMRSTIDFDGTTQEFAQFSIAMPKGWNESTVTAQYLWTATSGSGSVVWGLRGVAISDDDLMDASFGTNVQTTDTLIATTDLHISAESSAVTIAGSPAENDWVVFEVNRVPADASDTLAADARLIGVRLFITTNAANDA